MANRIKVAIVHSVLTLRQQGWSLRRIARTLDLDRETVARHVRLAQVGPKPATNLSTGSSEPAESKPANLSAGNLARPSSAPADKCGGSGPKSLCDPWRQVIEDKLDQGLTAQRIWQDLVAEQGFTGRYASVKRFVRRLGKALPLPFRRMECAPGEQAQIDFGSGAPVEQPSGRRKRYPVLRVVLGYSRKGYSEALRGQTTEDFIRSLENSFRAFGGVPKVLILDNLKAAVLQADWYDPELNPKIQAFGRHYGCVTLPTKPRTPRHKGKVESGVRYVCGNALKGRVFKSLQEANEALQHWEAHVADLRIHGTTKKQVWKRFQEEERPALLPLPATPFPFFHEAQRSVHRDAHVEVDKAYYSVPPEYLGHTVWVRWDAKLVRVFNGRMEEIAAHVKHQPGRFSTDPSHIASDKISGVERGAGYLLKRISLVGPETLRWAQTMLQERGIEGVRVLQGLLAMTRKYSADSLERASARALSHGAFRLRSLRALMQTRTQQEQFEFAEAHPLIRPMDFYGRYIQVSFRKEDRAGNRDDEFVALQATSGDEKGKSPAPRSGTLSAVQPPVSALGSLPALRSSAATAGEEESSGALSSEPALGSLFRKIAPVNPRQERIAP
jgi:transposase